ncbi:MAG: Gfo/Idh/MocA family oxidoreductase [Nitrososphaerota archaeon]|nr:Gfo/Idh/MocA family oxidoreductase [Candidatus Bathyarchaeota archaeon]MCX8162875.1 Gfo/Idh/MocA family oxidoreductase [Candidatus Bathyarchaeota archaeon]MDW8062352.1 Gfo/Idh/MocA family oxidoreductase [Nitrososphaerota archaeon]
MSGIRIGIIGAGGIAGTHAKFYRELNVKLTGVCDIIEERALSFAEKFGVPKENVFINYKDLIDSVELDAVSVCTPHSAHAEPTIYALKHGLDVLVEKPMATSGVETLEMLKAAEESGRILMVGFQTRFEPEIIAARRFVANGLLGDFYYGESVVGEERRRAIPGESFTRKDISRGGVLLDLGCYALDNAFYILGSPIPNSVYGYAASAIGRRREAVVEGGWRWNPEVFEVEDFFVGIIRLDGGGILLVKVAWAMHNDNLGETFFMGNRGGLKLNPLRLYRDENRYMTTSQVILPRRGEEAWREKIYRFVEAVSKRLPSPIDPVGIVVEQYVIDALYESADKRREVDIKIPPEVLEKYIASKTKP